MRFGDARIGAIRFGASTASAGSDPSHVEVASEGAVSALVASTGDEGSLSVKTTGRPVALAMAPTTDPRIVEASTTGRVSEIATGTEPVKWHVTAGGDGEISGTVLTFEAKYPDLVATVSPERDLTERDRIESYLKRPFETAYPATQSGGVRVPGEFSVLIDLFGEMADGIDGAKNDVLGARLIDLAYGESLDNIGTLLLLPRRTNETDTHYRLRLKAHARALTGEATIDQVRETIALLLDCDVSDIGLSEPEFQPAQFDLRIDQTIVDAASVTIDDVDEFVMRFRAGGVKITLTVSGSFTHRSIDDFRDNIDLGEKGYQEAGYSGRVI